MFTSTRTIHLAHDRSSGGESLAWPGPFVPHILSLKLNSVLLQRRRRLFSLLADMLLAGLWLFLLAQVIAAINVTESSTTIVISNTRLVVSLTKSKGSIQGITLDGQDLLGASGQGL
jgi:hypothetical protein